MRCLTHISSLNGWSNAGRPLLSLSGLRFWESRRERRQHCACFLCFKMSRRFYYPSGKFQSRWRTSHGFLLMAPFSILVKGEVTEVLWRLHDVTAVLAMRHCELQYKKGLFVCLQAVSLWGKSWGVFSQGEAITGFCHHWSWFWAYYSGWKWNSTFLKTGPVSEIKNQDVKLRLSDVILSHHTFEEIYTLPLYHLWPLLYCCKPAAFH